MMKRNYSKHKTGFLIIIVLFITTVLLLQGCAKCLRTQTQYVNEQYCTRYSSSGHCASYSFRQKTREVCVEYEITETDDYETDAYTSSTFTSPNGESMSASAAELYNMGVKYYQSGDYEKAISSFTQSIKESPTSDAYYNRGVSYYDLKKYDLAFLDYSSALLLNPQYTSAYFNRALLYCAMEEYEKGLSDLRNVEQYNDGDISQDMMNSARSTCKTGSGTSVTGGDVAPRW